MQDIITQSGAYRKYASKAGKRAQWGSFLSTQTPIVQRILNELCSPSGEQLLNISASYEHTWDVLPLFQWYAVLERLVAPSWLRSRVLSLLYLAVPKSMVLKELRGFLGEGRDTAGKLGCVTSIRDRVSRIFKSANAQAPTWLTDDKDMHPLAHKLFAAFVGDDSVAAVVFLRPRKFNGERVASYVRQLGAVQCAGEILALDTTAMFGIPRSSFTSTLFSSTLSSPWNIAHFLSLLERFSSEVATTVPIPSIIRSYPKDCTTVLHTMCTKICKGKHVPAPFCTGDLKTLPNMLTHGYADRGLDQCINLVTWLHQHGLLFNEEENAEQRLAGEAIASHLLREVAQYNSAAASVAPSAGAGSVAPVNEQEAAIVKILSLFKSHMEARGYFTEFVRRLLSQCSKDNVYSLLRIGWDAAFIKDAGCVQEIWSKFDSYTTSLSVRNVIAALLKSITNHGAVQLHATQIQQLCERCIWSKNYEVAEILWPAIRDTDALDVESLVSRAMSSMDMTLLKWLHKNVGIEELPSTSEKEWTNFISNIIHSAKVEDLEWVHANMRPASEWYNGEAKAMTSFASAIKFLGSLCFPPRTVYMWLHEHVLPACQWMAAPALCAIRSDDIPTLQWCADVSTMDLKRMRRKIFTESRSESAIEIVERLLTEDDKQSLMCELLYSKQRNRRSSTHLRQWAKRQLRAVSKSAEADLDAAEDQAPPAKRARTDGDAPSHDYGVDEVDDISDDDQWSGDEDDDEDSDDDEEGGGSLDYDIYNRPFHYNSDSDDGELYDGNFHYGWDGGFYDDEYDDFEDSGADW